MSRKKEEILKAKELPSLVDFPSKIDAILNRFD